MNVQDFIALMSGFAGLATAIGVLITNVQQNKKTTAIMQFRLDKIDEKLDEHNGYAKKFGEIEKAIVAIQKDIQYIREGK